MNLSSPENPRKRNVCERVLRELQTYSNFDALEVEQKEKVINKIYKLFEIVFAMRPDGSDDYLFQATANMLFSILDFKSGGRTCNRSSN